MFVDFLATAVVSRQPSGCRRAALSVLALFIGFLHFSGQPAAADAAQNSFEQSEIQQQNSSFALSNTSAAPAGLSSPLLAGGEEPTGRFVLRHRGDSVLQALRTQRALSVRGQAAGPRAAAAAGQARAIAANERSRLQHELRALGKNEARVIKADFQKAVNASVLEDLDARAVDTLKAKGFDIQPERIYSIALQDSVNLIGAAAVHALIDGSGQQLDGRGIDVGVLDSGIDYTHEAFGSCTTAQFQAGACARVPAGRNFLTPGSPPLDDNKHGTHVAGIIGSSGSLPGVAPGVRFHALKVCNASGGCYEGAILEAIEYAVDPNDDGDFSDRLDVINLSLGGGGDPDDALSQGIDAAAAAGIVPVVAAGNSGPSALTIGSPGTARSAITVAASYARSYDGIYGADTNPRQNQAAYFSSRGPVRWSRNYLLKPDIIAPGVLICAAKASASSLAECQPGHIPLSGTSMATPHVAGVAALMLQAHPAWGPREVKNVLLGTAIKIADPATGHDYAHTVQGYGRVDALAAVQEADDPLIAELALDSPLENSSSPIPGSAYGGGFQSYQLHMMLEGESSWTLIAESTTPVIDGTLATIDAFTYASGEHDLRLTVSGSGRTRYAYAKLLINNVVISDPPGLAVSDAENARLYSGRTALAVRGSARSAAFSAYRIEYCLDGSESCSSAGVVLEGGGQQQVNDALLGTIHFEQLENLASGVYRIRLILTRTDAEEEQAEVMIYVDPAILPGFPVHVPPIGSGLVLSMLEQPKLADLNSDRASEILFSYGETVEAFDGGGQRAAGWPYIRPGANEQTPMSASDINNDGAPEVIARLKDNRLHIFSAEGSLLSSSPALLFLESSAIYRPTSIADLDGDGMKEMITADLQAIRSNWTNPAGWNAAADNSPAENETYWNSGPAIGDLDGDGSLEVISTTNRYAESNIDDYIYAFSANGALRWRSSLPRTGPLSEPAMGDVDNDGRMEVFVLQDNDSAGQRSAYLYSYEGTLLPGWPKTFTAGSRASMRIPAPILADVDLDGFLEMILLANKCAVVLEHNGDLKRQICHWAVRFDYGVQAANVDADNELEILPSASGGSGYVVGSHGVYQLPAFNYDGTAAGGFPKSIVSSGGTESAHRAVGDVDGDGRTELVLIRSGFLYAWDLNACPSAAPHWPTYGGTDDYRRVPQAASSSLCGVDADNDQVRDNLDNCPSTANTNQADLNADGQGDACDDDDDGDFVPDIADNCPRTANANQADMDQDGAGDSCDTDRDGDSIANGSDNCPSAANHNQRDLDQDGQGDTCDADRDGDGFANVVDTCPDNRGAQLDTDRDGRGDICDEDDDNDGLADIGDNCPNTANPDQTDTDGNGEGDACTDDLDGDGISNSRDNCRYVSNSGQRDLDADGFGDVCDPDDDGDEIKDGRDNCPSSPNGSQADSDADGRGDACDEDADNDGTGNEQEDLNGTDPLDSESDLRVLGPRACAPLNTFLGMLNVLEVRNQSLSDKTVILHRVDQQRNDLGALVQAVPALGQYDFLSHTSINGSLIGSACAQMVDAAEGDLDGMMVFYKPSSNGRRMEFAVAVDLSGGKRGTQIIPWNTFHPSLDPADRGNAVAVFSTIINESEEVLHGAYQVYSADASLLEEQHLALQPSERLDIPVHTHGADRVGMLRWQPQRPDQPARFMSARYVHNNPFFHQSYSTAFIIEGRRGSAAEQVIPLDTAGKTAVVELLNVSDTSDTTLNVLITDQNGVERFNRDIYVPRFGSFHVIADSILAGAKGAAIISSVNGEKFAAVGMHYQRTGRAGLEKMYGMPAEQPLGTVLRASYNTFLNQTAELLLVNAGDREVAVDWLVQRLDQTIVAARRTVIPPRGVAVEEFTDVLNTYGFVAANVPADQRNTVAAWLLRKNADHILPVRAAPQ